MAAVKRLRFSTVIAAPVSRVFDAMIDPAIYTQWTTAFAEGCYFEGSWQPGQRIRFLSPGGDGMLAEIAENRRNEFISIRHLGFVSKGVEDTTSVAARAWAPAYENYTFAATPEGTTRLTVDMDVAQAWEKDMAEAWPKALARLKALCEGA
jgi:uncharacterized protein YndB with AHSA1/START domain